MVVVLVTGSHVFVDRVIDGMELDFGAGTRKVQWVDEVVLVVCTRQFALLLTIVVFVVMGRGVPV